MDIKDSFHISASKDEVRGHLLNVDILSACIPGLESLSLENDNTYSGQIIVKVGPIRAQFEGTVNFISAETPDRLEAEIEAKDKLSSSNIKGSFTSELSAENGGTRVDYQIKILIRGKLAQFGMPVVRATTKKMAAQFGKCLQNKIQQMIQDD